jgi:16S rRNA C1402 N4-methylase RsmH
MIATVVHWLEGHVPPCGLVVDLGAGTGGLSFAILKALPDVRLELVDIDPDMLEVAAERCSMYDGRYECRHARFEDQLPRCHAVVASLAPSPPTARSASCTEAFSPHLGRADSWSWRMR